MEVTLHREPGLQRLQLHNGTRCAAIHVCWAQSVLCIMGRQFQSKRSALHLHVATEMDCLMNSSACPCFPHDPPLCAKESNALSTSSTGSVLHQRLLARQ